MVQGALALLLFAGTVHAGEVENRLLILEQRLTEADAGMRVLIEDARKLTQRADSAKRREETDGFFPFDLDRLREDMWRRRLDLVHRHKEAESLAAKLPTDGSMKERVGRTRRAAQRLQGRLLAFDVASLELELAIKMVPGRLLGTNSAWYVATIRAEVKEAELNLEHVIDALKE